MKSNKKPTLSVITATYNRREKLKRNLQSVKSQYFSNIEHIIVDNLSIDGTEILINQYKKNVPYKVVYIREKDKGIYDALNKGIKIANGKWIHILHSDDFYYDNNSLKNIFKKDLGEVDLIANSILVRKTGKKDLIWDPAFDSKLNFYNFPHTGTIIKNNFYERYGLYNDKYGVISDAIHQIETYGHANYRIIKKPIIVMGSGGVSSIMDFNYLKERFILIFRYHKFPFFVKARFFLSDLIGFLKNSY